MSPDQKFSVIVAGLTLIFLVLSATLGLMVRVIIKWTKSEDRIAMLTEDMKELVADKDKTHREILDQMREDRKATNERLTYLERFVWPVKGRRK